MDNVGSPAAGQGVDPAVQTRGDALVRAARHGRTDHPLRSCPSSWGFWEVVQHRRKPTS